MTNGLCDVKGCQGLPLLGWRPLTERLGRQICDQHWRRHQDEKDSFDLFDEFGFRRPAGICKPISKKDVPLCQCGRERLSGHKFCTACADERERHRKRQAYHKRRNPEHEPIVQEDILQCRDCDGPRESGHTYCLECAEILRSAFSVSAFL
jgi:hypothetical protein